MSPRRDECRHRIEPCGVGVGVRRDIDAALSRLLDLRHDVRHPAPVGFARGLDVPHLDGNRRFTADANRFVERRHHAVAFRSHVRRVDPAVFRRFRSQRDQFFSGGIGRRRVLERRRDAGCALLHRLAHEGLHSFELACARRAIVFANDETPDLRRADVGGEVDADALLLEPREVLAQAAPVGRDLHVLVKDLVGLDDRVGERRNGAALACHFGGNALKDLRRQVRIDQDGHLRLPEHVDEARRDDATFGIDATGRRGASEVADSGYPSVADADIAGKPGRSGSVDDPSVFDDNVERRRSHRRRRVRRRTRSRCECQRRHGRTRDRCGPPVHGAPKD